MRLAARRVGENRASESPDESGLLDTLRRQLAVMREVWSKITSRALTLSLYLALHLYSSNSRPPSTVTITRGTFDSTACLLVLFIGADGASRGWPVDVAHLRANYILLDRALQVLLCLRWEPRTRRIAAPHSECIRAKSTGPTIGKPQAFQLARSRNCE